MFFINDWDCFVGQTAIHSALIVLKPRKQYVPLSEEKLTKHRSKYENHLKIMTIDFHDEQQFDDAKQSN